MCEMTHQTRRSRAWLAALPLLGITAGIVVGLVASVVLRPGPSSVSAAAFEPSPTPISAVAAASPTPGTPKPEETSPASPAPKASPRPTATPQPAASAAPASTETCRPNDLSGRILAWDGAAGSRIAEVELRNTAGADCTIAELTALRLVAADGTVLIDSSEIVGTPPIAPDAPATTVAAGGSIRTDVRVANYCGDLPKGAIGVSFSFARPSGTVVALPGADVSSADAIPPCNGPIGPEIEMNGWQQ